ncbi:hypothetical protein DEO72_LG11g1570 [Vigna unguiculata]|uniref:Uncharacterized protein n=1 Tax=Vigna unguiculata TaxID=3917 RepID=A0A4D6NS10_VIGUN|nr:hypothetical protein DEO72_LG11g1570 [Vigna unguiculata]
MILQHTPSSRLRATSLAHRHHHAPPEEKRSCNHRESRCRHCEHMPENAAGANDHREFFFLMHQPWKLPHLRSPHLREPERANQNAIAAPLLATIDVPHITAQLPQPPPSPSQFPQHHLRPPHQTCNHR